MTQELKATEQRLLEKYGRFIIDHNEIAAEVSVDDLERIDLVGRSSNRVAHIANVAAFIDGDRERLSVGPLIAAAPKTEPWKDTRLSALGWIHKNHSKFVYTRSQICGSALEYGSSQVPAKKGIYFLLAGGEIIYVGKSERSVNARLRQHIREGREFTRFWYVIDVPDLFISDLEGMYIHAFRPAQNAYFPACVVFERYIKRISD